MKTKEKEVVERFLAKRSPSGMERLRLEGATLHIRLHGTLDNQEFTDLLTVIEDKLGEATAVVIDMTQVTSVQLSKTVEILAEAALARIRHLGCRRIVCPINRTEDPAFANLRMALTTLGMKISLLIRFDHINPSISLPTPDETGKRGQVGVKIDYADRTHSQFAFVRVAFESTITPELVKAYLRRAVELLRSKNAPPIVSISVLQAHAFATDCSELLLDGLASFKELCKHLVWITPSTEHQFLSSSLMSRCQRLAIPLTRVHNYVDAIEAIERVSKEITASPP